MDLLLAYVLFAVIFGAASLVLYAIVRSTISTRRTRGARDRLRTPDLPAIDTLCGFPLPPELATFYRSSPLIARTECELVDRTMPSPAIRELGDLVPLCPVDIREERATTGCPGCPIARDLDKGAYYVDRAGAVRMFSPNVRGGDVQVAPTVAAFFAFEAQGPSDRGA